MSKNPINLVVRFLLELMMWASIGYWGWTQHQGIWRFALGIGLTLLAMVLWGVFRVPNDPGKAPVAVPGMVRLALEAVEFGGAAAGLFLCGLTGLAIIFAVITLINYALSYDRVLRLLKTP